MSEFSTANCSSCKFLDLLEQPIGKYKHYCLNMAIKAHTITGAGAISTKVEVLRATGLTDVEDDETNLIRLPAECICELYAERPIEKSSEA